MRTATIIIETVDTPLPTGGPFSGFELTVIRPDGNQVTLPIDAKLVWAIGGLVEGASYQLILKAVDSAGAAIYTMPAQTLTVPSGTVALTYPKPIGIAVEWS